MPADAPAHAHKLLQRLNTRLPGGPHVRCSDCGNFLGVSFPTCLACRLLERMPEDASAHALKFFQTRGATVLLNERVLDYAAAVGIPGPHVMRTDKSRELAADVVLSAIGTQTVLCQRCPHNSSRPLINTRNAITSASWPPSSC